MAIPITDDLTDDLSKFGFGAGFGPQLGASVERYETTLGDGRVGMLPWPSEEQPDEGQESPDDVLWPSSVNGIKTDPGGWVDISERSAWRPF